MQAPPERTLVVVTGASTRIGVDATLALAREGFHIVAGVRALNKAQEDFKHEPRITTILVRLYSY